MGDSVISLLREVLLKYFSEAELVMLCREFGVVYEDLKGSGPLPKTRALIAELKDRNRLDTLIARIHDIRPEAYMSSGLASQVVHQRIVSRISGSRAQTPRRAKTRKNTLRVAASFAVILFVVMGSLVAVNLVNPISNAPVAELAALPESESQANTLPQQPPSASVSAADKIKAAFANVAPDKTPIIKINVPNAPQPEVTGLLMTPSDVAKNLNALVDNVATNLTSLENVQNWSATAQKDFAKTHAGQLPPAAGSKNPNSISSQYSHQVDGTTVDHSTPDSLVVRTKEQWEFPSPSGEKVCQTGEYIYTLAKQNNELTVISFAATNVVTGCQQTTPADHKPITP